MQRSLKLVTLVVTLAIAAAACSADNSRVAFETRAAVPAGRTSTSIALDASSRQEGGLLPVEPTAGGRPSAADAFRSGAVRSAADGPAATGHGSDDVIKIGTVLPLQGGQRDFGEPVLRVTQAFIDEVNARGGIGGHRLELVAYDACLNCQDAALAAVKRLVEQDHVFALVNTYVMAVAFIPVIPYLDEHHIPLIQGGAENMTTDALSPVTFATAPPGLFYVRFMIQVVKRYLQVQKIGVVYLNVPSEANGIPYLEREARREGVDIVREEPINAEEDAVTNMDAAVTRIRVAGAEGVISTNPVLLAFGRLAADRQNWPVPWYGPAAWSHLLETSCGKICDDVVFTDTAGLSYVDRDSAQMHQFIDTVHRRYPGGATTGHELAAWVGMQLFSEVLSRTGPDADAFIAELNRVRNLDVGTTTPLLFTPDRHLGGTATTLLKLKDGKYVRASEPLDFGTASP